MQNNKTIKIFSIVLGIVMFMAIMLSLVPAMSMTVYADATIQLHFTMEDAEIEAVDASEEEGWWQVIAQNEYWYITISNNYGNSAQIPGEYEWSDFDLEFTYIQYLGNGNKIPFTNGSCLIIFNEGIYILTGDFRGANGATYNVCPKLRSNLILKNTTILSTLSTRLPLK